MPSRMRASRSPVALTYFEFGTLAALLTLRRRPAASSRSSRWAWADGSTPSTWSTPDVAVITSHRHRPRRLPRSRPRASIGREKAGILRAGRPAVVRRSACHPARCSMSRRACGADLRILGRDFGYVAEDRQWRYWTGRGDSPRACPIRRCAARTSSPTPRPPSPRSKRSRERLPVSARRSATVCPRRAPGPVPGPARPSDGRARRRPQSARRPGAGSHARHHGVLPARPMRVVGMLADKDLDGRRRRARAACRSLACGDRCRDHAARARRRFARRWSAAASIRSASPSTKPSSRPSLQRADAARPDDRIMVFGSFLTVAAVLPVARARAPSLTSHG